MKTVTRTNQQGRDSGHQIYNDYLNGQQEVPADISWNGSQLMDNSGNWEHQEALNFEAKTFEQKNEETFPLNNENNNNNHEDDDNGYDERNILIKKNQFESEQKALSDFHSDIQSLNLKTNEREKIVINNKSIGQIDSLKENIDISPMQYSELKSTMQILQNQMNTFKTEQNDFKNEYQSQLKKEILKFSLENNMDYEQSIFQLRAEIVHLRDLNVKLQSSNGFLQEKLLQMSKDNSTKYRAYITDEEANNHRLDDGSFNGINYYPQDDVVNNGEKFSFRKRNSFQSDCFQSTKMIDNMMTITTPNILSLSRTNEFASCPKIMENYMDKSSTTTSKTTLLNGKHKTLEKNDILQRRSLFDHQQQQHKRHRNNPFNDINYYCDGLNGITSIEETLIALDTAGIIKENNKKALANTLNNDDDDNERIVSTNIYLNKNIKKKNQPILIEKGKDIKLKKNDDEKEKETYPKSTDWISNINNNGKCSIVRNLNVNAKCRQTYKIIMIGDSTVGKTSLIYYIRTGSFRSDLCPTIGIDFQTVRVQIDNEFYDVQLWDTAGQERYHSITKNYYRRIDAIYIVYDISKENTFLNIRNWITSIRDTILKPIPMLLIGNKIDLRPLLNHCVPYNEGFRLAKEIGNNCGFIETSCKNGLNVDETIILITRMIIGQPIQDFYNNNNIEMRIARNNESKCC